MARLAVLVCALTAACHPTGPAGPGGAGSGSGAGDGSGSGPARSAEELFDEGTRGAILTAGDAELISLPDRYWLRIAAAPANASVRCGPDLEELLKSIRRCQASMAQCGGVSWDKLKLYFTEILGADRAMMQIGNDVAYSYTTTEGTVYEVGRDLEKVRRIGAALGQLAATSATPEGAPAGLRGATASAAPCCSTCGRCAPGQCEVPPPVERITADPEIFRRYLACKCDEIERELAAGNLDPDCPCCRYCRASSDS